MDYTNVLSLQGLCLIIQRFRMARESSFGISESPCAQKKEQKPHIPNVLCLQTGQKQQGDCTTNAAMLNHDCWKM